MSLLSPTVSQLRQRVSLVRVPWKISWTQVGSGLVLGLSWPWVTTALLLPFFSAENNRAKSCHIHSSCVVTAQFCLCDQQAAEATKLHGDPFLRKSKPWKNLWQHFPVSITHLNINRLKLKLHVYEHIVLHTQRDTNTCICTDREMTDNTMHTHDQHRCKDIDKKDIHTFSLSLS